MVKSHQTNGQEHPSHELYFSNYRDVQLVMNLSQAGIAEKLRGLEAPGKQG